MLWTRLDHESFLWAKDLAANDPSFFLQFYPIQLQCRDLLSASEPTLFKQTRSGWNRFDNAHHVTPDTVDEKQSLEWLALPDARIFKGCIFGTRFRCVFKPYSLTRRTLFFGPYPLMA